MDDFENINKLLQEIARLKQAHDLLEEVWDAAGPYFMPNWQLPPELKSELQRYFKFNDGE